MGLSAQAMVLGHIAAARRALQPSGLQVLGVGN